MANSRVSVNKKSCKCSFRTVRVETLERVAEVKDNSHTLRTLNLGLIVTCGVLKELKIVEGVVS